MLFHSKMMSIPDQFDCAIALDGGSLSLAWPVRGEMVSYVLNRSINARGTCDFETVARNGCMLSGEDERALLNDLLGLLERLDAANGCADIVKEFVSVLQCRHGA